MFYTVVIGLLRVSNRIFARDSVFTPFFKPPSEATHRRSRSVEQVNHSLFFFVKYILPLLQINFHNLYSSLPHGYYYVFLI